MKFRVLGPLTAATGGRGVHLGGPRQRAVLAALLLHANRPVTTEHLTELVWDDPPVSAAANLRKFLWGLRTALTTAGEPGRIIRDNGVRLLVHPGELDLWAFDDLVREGRDALTAGRPEEAAAKLRRALALAPEPPLSGLRPTTRLAALRADLRERRDTAADLYFRVRLDLGQHAETLPELGAEIAAQPLREPAAALLMLALHRCGRRDKALEVYRRIRGLLVDRLGVEPGEELRELHRRILRDDPVLSVNNDPHGPVAQLPAAPPVFAGRRDAQATLTALRHDGTPVAVVSGTAGVGKTALAVHWGHTNATSFPDGQLYVDLHGYSPGGAPVTPEEALAGFLGALGAHTPPPGLDARAAVYRSLLAGRRMLIVLDNARDAGQVTPLLPGAPGTFTIVTSRDRLGGLIATGAHPLHLDVLPPAEATELLTARLGPQRPTPETLTRVIDHCARLPLALSLVAARAAAHPGFGLTTLLDDLLAGDLDAFDAGPGADLRSAFSWSHRALPEPSARLFRLLGAHPGPDVTAHEAAALAEVEPRAARRMLTDLDRAQLVTEYAPGRYSAHDLLRGYARELVRASPERPEALRRLLDHLLATALRASALVEPHRRALPGAEPVSTVPLASAEEANRWFRAEWRTLVEAAEEAGREGLHGHAWRLVWAVSVFLRRHSLGEAWLRVLRTGRESADRAHDLLGQAEIRYLLAIAENRHGDRSRLGVLLDEAEERYALLGDHYGLAGVEFVRTWPCEARGDITGALAHATRVLELYRKAGHHAGEGRALGCVAWHHALLGEDAAALGHARAALERLAEIGDVGGQAGVWDTMGYVELRMGRFGRAAEAYVRSIAFYRDAGDRYNLPQPLTALGEAELGRGDTAAARRAFEEALALLEILGLSGAEDLRTRLAAL